MKCQLNIIGGKIESEIIRSEIVLDGLGRGENILVLLLFGQSLQVYLFELTVPRWVLLLSASPLALLRLSILSRPKRVLNSLSAAMLVVLAFVVFVLSFVDGLHHLL